MSEFSKMIKSNIVPQVTKNYENDGILHFIVEDVPICIANGLRRTIISDIPVVVVRTENSKINQAQVQTNTSRFHNEIIKQRLSCIPFITQDLEELPEHYRLVVEKKNTKSSITIGIPTPCTLSTVVRLESATVQVHIAIFIRGKLN